jgi:hypothetical protein
MSVSHGAGDLIESEMDGTGITILRVLDEEAIGKVTIVVAVLTTNCHVSE